MRHRFLAGVFLVLTWPGHGLAADDSELLVYYQYAVYLTTDNTDDITSPTAQFVQETHPVFEVRESVMEPPERAVMVLTMVDDAQADYAPPSPEMIRYFGRGLSKAQAQALQDSKRVLVFDFLYPAAPDFDAFKAALQIVRHVADVHEGLIWDEATREIFSVDEWTRQRLETWSEGIPSAEDHITIHAYNDGDYVRAISLGMEKFGLPDIVVQEFPWSLDGPVGNLINLAAQTLVEGQDFSDQFSLDVDVGALRHLPIRERLQGSLLEEASGAATLYFRAAANEPGDPENFLLELRFDLDDQRSALEQQQALLDDLFGFEDSVAMIDHDAQLLAASERARSQLPELRTAFNEGLAPGETIYLKAPFDTPDGGREWMWVEVIEWRKERIRGLLMNQPVYIPDLKAGTQVTIDQEEVFDYIQNHADGTQSGNETGKLISRGR